MKDRAEEEEEDDDEEEEEKQHQSDNRDGNDGDVLSSCDVIGRTAVTHGSRPVGSRGSGQVTCSRWGCSAHS